MIDKKELRTELFKHIDGIALTAPISGLFSKHNDIFDSLKSTNKINLNLTDLKIKGINVDYLNVTLRLFESQGWIERKIIKDKSIEIIPSEIGSEIFKNAYLYKIFFNYFKFLINLNFMNDDNYTKYSKLINDYNKLKNLTKNQTILKHIEGLIVGTTLVALKIDNLIDVDKNNELIIDKKINRHNKESITSFLTKFKFLNNSTVTEKGNFFIKRSAAYGVTVSYMPLFNKIDSLLFGKTKNILNRDKNGNEKHVNRKMNVWGSGGAHKLYFKKIDEIVLEIFNRPLEKQPQGIADMGCGDGTLLKHLYNLIKTKTLRGKNLNQFPLYVIGADFNDEALDVTGNNLKQAEIKHHLVKADIGNPASFNDELEKKYNIHLNNLLSVRSFLDHNRIFKMPKIKNFDLEKIKTNSTSAFSTNDNNDIYEPIIFKLSLVEHFLKWKPFISKYGLILLELHTINPKICQLNIGKTLATAYDATHGFSNQYIIEYEDFIDSAKLAGLKHNSSFEFNFPNNKLTTVSINLFSL